MPCCKAEEFKWCSSLDTTIADDEEEYCIFHAPEGQKRIATEEFNGLVFKRIQEAKDSGQKCDLSGTLFEGSINFSQYGEGNPLPLIEFQGATFVADTDFTRVTFNEEVGFDKVFFKERASFSGATFKGC